MQHLTIVTTGGTIDKIYFDDKSQFQIGDPQIGEILEALGVAFTFEVVPVMRKDSLHMDDHDRAEIRAAIERQPHRPVQSLPDGVYIAMNGRVWDPMRVRKNVDANRFEEAGP